MDEKEMARRKQRLEEGKKKRLEEQRKRKRRRRLIRKIVRIVMLILMLAILIGFGVLAKILVESIIDKGKEEVLETPVINESVESVPEPARATILSGGDVILHSPFLSSSVYSQPDGSYYFHDIFRYMKDVYTEADFTVLNLETTINDTKYSGYPRFRSPASIVTALKDNGVDMCLIANNHIYDNGDHGFYLTMDTLDAHNMVKLGGRRSALEEDYVIQIINGIKVGFMNYVYATGSSGSRMINGLPVKSQTESLINTFTYENLDHLYSRIGSNLSEMKAAGVDYTIVYLHWGEEYQLVENEKQREIAQRLSNLGVDALIGGHPHVVQPVDLIPGMNGSHNMVCFYSVGNHLSNQQKEYVNKPSGHTEDGIMPRLTIEKDHEGKVRLVGAEAVPTWVYRTPESMPAEYYVFSLEDSSILGKVTNLNITQDYVESLNRTKAIVGEGLRKVQGALPLLVE